MRKISNSVANGEKQMGGVVHMSLLRKECGVVLFAVLVGGFVSDERFDSENCEKDVFMSMCMCVYVCVCVCVQV